MTLVQEEQRQLQSQNLVNTKNTAVPFFQPPIVLSEKAQTLLDTLKKDNWTASDFDLLYGTSIKAANTIQTEDLNTLEKVVSGTDFKNQNSWLFKMHQAASLYMAIQYFERRIENFKTVHGLEIPQRGLAPSEGARDLLYAMTTAGDYSKQAILEKLDHPSVSEAPPVPPIPSEPSEPTEPPSPEPTIPTPPSIPALPGMLFSPASVWNTKLSPSEALHANSEALVSELVRNTELPGKTWINSNKFSTALHTVDASVPKVPVAIVQNGLDLTTLALYQELQKGVPIPVGIQAAAGTDGHLTILDTSTDTLYEFWKFRYENGRYVATWGGVLKNVGTSNGLIPVTRNERGGQEMWGATATGLPVIAGTILSKEVQAGVIPHALAFAIPQAARTFVWPATRSDGPNTAANAIPQGAQFRLPADVNIDPNWSPMIQMMVIAVRDYGMILRDTAGAATFYAEDTTPQGIDNPYAAYYDGKPLWKIMEEFPWEQLQALAY